MSRNILVFDCLTPREWFFSFNAHLFENDYLFFAMVEMYDKDIKKFKEIYHYILTNTDKYNELITNWGQPRLKRENNDRKIFNAFKFAY